MPNTREDRLETAAKKAILAMKHSLVLSGVSEREGLEVLRHIAKNLLTAVSSLDTPDDIDS